MPEPLPRPSDAVLTKQDAKSLYAALDALAETLRHVTTKGARLAVERVDDAFAEATVLLEALEDEYAAA